MLVFVVARQVERLLGLGAVNVIFCVDALMTESSARMHRDRRDGKIDVLTLPLFLPLLFS